MLVILVALACASITVLGNGSWREVAAVIPASALAFWLHRRMGSWQLNHLATVLISAATASALYVGFTALLDLALGGPSPRVAAGFISACIFLIPGFPLVTAGLDLTRIDLQAGIPRLVYAAMVLLSITIGVWLVAILAGLSADPVPPLDAATPVVLAVSAVASFFAVFGWAAMFNSPLRMAVASGVIAAACNLPRLLMLDQGAPSPRPRPRWRAPPRPAARNPPTGSTARSLCPARTPPRSRLPPCRDSGRGQGSRSDRACAARP